jgi:CDP-diacylglycerol---glycerol-3-phosphate 3-phosphatidyltransferase
MRNSLPSASSARGTLLNLPNSLTLTRIFLVPFLVGVLLVDKGALAGDPEVVARLTVREILGVGLFLAASLTDWLDGWFARRRGQVTTLGVLLDPIADKLLVCSALIALAYNRYAEAWMVIILVGRELAVSGLRSVASSLGVVMAASGLGKFKTAAQIVAITLMILTNSLEKWGIYRSAAMWALVVAMVLSVWSAVMYFTAFLKKMPWTDPR